MYSKRDYRQKYANGAAKAEAKHHYETQERREKNKGGRNGARKRLREKAEREQEKGQVSMSEADLEVLIEERINQALEDTEVQMKVQAAVKQQADKVEESRRKKVEQETRIYGPIQVEDEHQVRINPPGSETLLAHPVIERNTVVGGMLVKEREFSEGIYGKEVESIGKGEVSSPEPTSQSFEPAPKVPVPPIRHSPGLELPKEEPVHYSFYEKKGQRIDITLLLVKAFLAAIMNLICMVLAVSLKGLIAMVLFVTICVVMTAMLFIVLDLIRRLKEESTILHVYTLRDARAKGRELWDGRADGISLQSIKHWDPKTTSAKHIRQNYSEVEVVCLWFRWSTRFEWRDSDKLKLDEIERLKSLPNQSPTVLLEINELELAMWMQGGISLELMSQLAIGRNVKVRVDDDVLYSRLEMLAERINTINFQRTDTIFKQHVVANTVQVAYAMVKDYQRTMEGHSFPKPLPADK